MITSCQSHHYKAKTQDHKGRKCNNQIEREKNGRKNGRYSSRSRTINHHLSFHLTHSLDQIVCPVLMKNSFSFWQIGNVSNPELKSLLNPVNHIRFRGKMFFQCKHSNTYFPIRNIFICLNVSLTTSKNRAENKEEIGFKMKKYSFFFLSFHLRIESFSKPKRCRLNQFSCLSSPFVPELFFFSFQMSPFMKERKGGRKKRKKKFGKKER